MPRPAFEIVEEHAQQKEETFLVIDTVGVLGAKVVRSIGDTTTVFVTNGTFSVESLSAKTICIPFTQNQPTIPSQQYAYILFVVNTQQEREELLPEILKKAHELHTRVGIVLPLSASADNIESLLEQPQVAVFILGDLFGEERLLGSNTVINSFLHQALTTSTIALPQTGMQKTHPVALDDAVKGILDVLFKPHVRSQLYLLFPKHAPTMLTLARVFQKAEPLLRIDFATRDSRAEEIHEIVVPKGEYLVGEYPATEKKIKSFFMELLEKATTQPGFLSGHVFARVSGYKEKGKSGSFFRIAVYFVFLLFLLPPLSSATFLLVGLGALQDGKSALEIMQFEQSKQAATKALFFFDIAGRDMQLVELEGRLIGSPEVITQGIHTIAIGKLGAAAVFSTAGGLHALVSVSEGKTNTPTETFLEGVNMLKNALTTFGKIKTEDIEKIPLVGESIQKLHTYASLEKLATVTIDVFPQLFGIDRKKTYLILFQNNMELRPGGGFIGSYGLLHLEKGRVADFTIHDVYDADGQLKGHIEPPFAIRRYLPAVHWYLRDSNFNVDFSKNASMAAFFLEQETKTPVDGVIGIDITVIKKVLETTGSVYVPEYDQTVTAENMYALTQAKAEKNFFPGSTQKKDFLSALAQALVRRLEERKNIAYLSLLRTVDSSIREKHIVFSFADPRLQNVFVANGMTSSLWDTRIPAEDTVVDFLGVSEANIGINKANYFIKRKISVDVFIQEDGTIHNTTTLLYKNESSPGVWPGGDYKVFLRLILPLGATVSGIIVDGQEQEVIPAVTDFSLYEAKRFVAPKGLEVETTEQDNKTIVGFLTIVPSTKLKTITVFYTLAQKAPVDTPSFLYDLKLFKQPGTEADPVSFVLHYPQSLNIVKKPQGFTNGEGRAKATFSLLEDYRYQFQFSQK